MDKMQEIELSTAPKKKKNRFLKILIAVLIVLVVSAGLYLLFRFVFVYKGAQIGETKAYNKDDIVEFLGIKEKTPLIMIDRSGLAKKISTEFPYLKDVSVKISFPDKIKVDFTEEFGEIKLNLGNDWFSVTKELYVLKILNKEEISDTKRVSLEAADIKKCVVGNELEFYTVTAKEAVDNMLKTLYDKNMFDDVTDIDMSDQFNIKICYLGRFNVTLGEAKDLTYKLDLMVKTANELESNIVADIDVTDSSTAYVRITSNTDS